MLVSEKSTVASIEYSNVGFKFDENGLYAMYYNFRPDLALNEKNDASEVALVRGFDLNTIETALTEKYGEPLEDENKYKNIKTVEASTYKELIALMKLKIYMGKGTSLAKQKAADKLGDKGYERVVELADGIVKIDHYVFAINEITIHELAYQFFTNAQVEEILNSEKSDETVKNDV